MTELTTMQTWLLTAIRKEGPLMAGTLKSDCRTLTRNGVEGLDENQVFRTLAELEAAGLIVGTLGGYMPVFEKQVKQGSLFA